MDRQRVAARAGHSLKALESENSSRALRLELSGSALPPVCSHGFSLRGTIRPI